MSQTLTPWFPPEVKPVRAGWYVSAWCPDRWRSPVECHWRRFWNGYRWSLSVKVGVHSNAECAHAMRQTSALDDYVYWAGLTK